MCCQYWINTEIHLNIRFTERTISKSDFFCIIWLRKKHSTFIIIPHRRFYVKCFLNAADKIISISIAFRSFKPAFVYFPHKRWHVLCIFNKLPHRFYLKFFTHYCFLAISCRMFCPKWHSTNRAEVRFSSFLGRAAVNLHSFNRAPGRSLAAVYAGELPQRSREADEQ